jgi:hypothetical protein
MYRGGITWTGESGSITERLHHSIDAHAAQVMRDIHRMAESHRRSLGQRARWLFRAEPNQDRDYGGEEDD